MRIRGLLFDFDGLILDTETALHAGWQWLYREHGLELPEDLWARTVGTINGFDAGAHLEELVGGPLDWESLTARRNEHELTLIEAEELRPGILEYLADAQRLGLKRAIVSSSSKDWVDLHLRRLEQAAGWDAIVTADHDIERAKPRPTLYLEALDALGLEPIEAIAFEDSPNGVRAAKAAGILCVAVPNSVTSAYRLDEADLVLESLAELPLPRLLEQADKRRRDGRDHDDREQRRA